MPLLPNLLLPTAQLCIFRRIDSKREFIIEDKRNNTVIIIHVSPGVIYEVAVTSITGNFKTNSDVQEILFKPSKFLIYIIKSTKCEQTEEKNPFAAKLRKQV